MWREGAAMTCSLLFPYLKALPRGNRLASERVQGGAMEGGVAGGEHGAGGVHVEFLAVPVGDDPAGALDDRHEGREVVELQPVLDDEVDVTRSQQAVGIAVAAQRKFFTCFASI